MSRTDKTKPWRVRVAEHQPWAVHDHSDGVCDLPESPLTPRNWRASCHWSDWNMMISPCCRKGCCRSCAGTDERKAKRKRERRNAKRDILKEPTVGKPRPKKNAAWCKGKVGRKHVEEVRWAKMYYWLINRDRIACYEAGPGNWRKGWQCYHEVGCSTCGKILRWTAPKEQCPDWQRTH